MPLYEYECTVCKHRFELLQKFSDEPARVCIQCGAPVIRLLSSPAIQFKGTGWYVTDYGGKSGVSSESKKESKDDGSGDKSDKAEKPSPAPPESTKESASASADKPPKN